MQKISQLTQVKNLLNPNRLNEASEYSDLRWILTRLKANLLLMSSILERLLESLGRLLKVRTFYPWDSLEPFENVLRGFWKHFFVEIFFFENSGVFVWLLSGFAEILWGILENTLCDTETPLLNLHFHFLHHIRLRFDQSFGKVIFHRH